MAVRTAEELIESISVLNDNDATKDLYVSLLEDITDSIPKDLADIRAKLVAAEEKAKQVEEEWRERYINRFKGVSDDAEFKSDVEDMENTDEKQVEEYREEDLIKEMKGE